MPLAEQRACAARLLTDAVYREAFFAAPPHASALFGLTAEEFRLLRMLDASRLAISSEGYAGKRFERLVGAFPRLLPLLDAHARGWRGGYLATTAFPPTEADEYATLQRFLATMPHPGSHAFQDVADLEWGIFSRRPGALVAPPPIDPEAPLRPAEGSVALSMRGPLPRLLAGEVGPAEYPPEPSRWLVTRRVPTLALEPLEGARAQAWDAAASGRSLHEVTALAGQTGAEAVAAWWRAGLVVPDGV